MAKLRRTAITPDSAKAGIIFLEDKDTGKQKLAVCVYLMDEDEEVIILMPADQILELADMIAESARNAQFMNNYVASVHRLPPWPDNLDDKGAKEALSKTYELLTKSRPIDITEILSDLRKKGGEDE